MEKKCRRTFANGVTVENHCDFELVELGGKDAWLTFQRGLLALRSVFDGYTKLNCWIAEGTALGFVRDGGFIPWDTDIDVHIGMTTAFVGDDDRGPYSLASDVFTHRTSIFQETGFELCRSMYWNRDGESLVTQLAYRDRLNENILFDVMFFYSSHPYAGCSRELATFDHWSECGVQKMPESILREDGGFVQLKDGSRIHLGVEPITYLEYRYGPDWRTPKKSRENRCRVKM